MEVIKFFDILGIKRVNKRIERMSAGLIFKKINL
jgi:hypothetical protein